MKGLDAAKAVGAALLVLALNFALVYLAVAAYAQFVEPGRSSDVYAAAAPRIAGWSAPIGGALLLLAAAYVLGRGRPERNALRFAGLIWLAYVVLDLGSGLAMGAASQMVWPMMALSMGMALAGALAGGALARPGAAAVSNVTS